MKYISLIYIIAVRESRFCANLRKYSKLERVQLCSFTNELYGVDS